MMKGLIEVRVTEKGNVWRKTVWFLGIPVYWRRDFNSEPTHAVRKQIGFEQCAPISGEINDDDF